ncbi:ComF family protein [Desulfurella sp.]|uniref:ComF family protein n=1 Tax=Desulfurella sp. TaxID=1962857 RepID=UPI0025C21570|nr:ComF family protein [Desulfurella sp.]
MLNVSILSNLIGSLKNLIFPSVCIFCQRPIKNGYICNDCMNDMIYKGPRCVKCSKPVNQNTLLCSNCSQKTYYEKGFVLFSYNNKKVASLIKWSKFSGHFYYLNAIKHFKENIDFSIFDDVEALIAVPMHKEDLQKRGYNQSLIIAKILSNLSDISVYYDFIEKTIQTKPQVGLKRHERQSNLKNAFILNPKVERFKKVLIVDDVVTTASTINECAKVLSSLDIKVNFFALASEF